MVRRKKVERQIRLFPMGDLSVGDGPDGDSVDPDQAWQPVMEELGRILSRGGFLEYLRERYGEADDESS